MILGFAPTIDRFIGYAVGGAKSLEAHGVPARVENPTPNYELLWELLFTTRRLYRWLTAILFLALGIGGTIVIEKLFRAEQALHPEFSLLMPRLAWAITLVSILLDIYSNWWGIFLRGLNESARRRAGGRGGRLGQVRDLNRVVCSPARGC